MATIGFEALQGLNDLTSIQDAAALLRAGGVVLHATEGVWGLACDPWNDDAIEKILTIKGRDANKGFILIGGNSAAFEQQLANVTAEHQQHALQSWPGHHTWILPDNFYPAIVKGGRSTIACRVPSHDQARALALEFGSPLISTSANRSGEPSIVDAAVAQQQFGSVVDLVMPGEVGQAGKASTIHGLDGTILR